MRHPNRKRAAAHCCPPHAMEKAVQAQRGEKHIAQNSDHHFCEC